MSPPADSALEDDSALEIVLRLAAFLLLTLLALAGAMTLWTVLALTRPPRRTYASALARGTPGDPGEVPQWKNREWSAWTFTHDQTPLAAWTIRGDDPLGPVFVLTHGWGDSKLGGLSRARALAPHASSLILWDQPAHGDSGGICSLGHNEPHALLTLLDTATTPRDRVVLLGWSLGAGVSIAAAANTSALALQVTPRVIAVIAEAPYRLPRTPAANVLARHHLPRFPTLDLALAYVGVRCGAGAAWPGFDRAQHARRLRVPLLVLRGELDDISPAADAAEILAATNTQPASRSVTVPAGRHHGLWTQPDSADLCLAETLDFLRSLAPAPPPVR